MLVIPSLWEGAVSYYPLVIHIVKALLLMCAKREINSSKWLKLNCTSGHSLKQSLVHKLYYYYGCSAEISVAAVSENCGLR